MDYLLFYTYAEAQLQLTGGKSFLTFNRSSKFVYNHCSLNNSLEAQLINSKDHHCWQT